MSRAAENACLEDEPAVEDFKTDFEEIDKLTELAIAASDIKRCVWPI